MPTIGIRREDKNEWERRAPLTPDHVAEIVESLGVEVTVQPSAIRAFPDKDYRAAGATMAEDLSGCRVILGIKEIPPELLLPRKTYLFFSHTSKGQDHNMPMLRRLMELGSTLIDFEHVKDERGRRLIFFGRYAGYAGMIDALWAVGSRLAAEGLATPFQHVRLAHEYSSLDEATHHLARLGERLRHAGVPEALRPFVCAFTGSGNVTLGATEIFDRLPIVEVLPEELEALVAGEDRRRNVLYKVTFRRDQRFEHVGGGPFDAEELAEHPERYRSGIVRWLRHLTLLVHGAFWKPPQPRLIDAGALRDLWSAAAVPRLRVLADVSCDVGGGIEATIRATTPGNPVFVYDPLRGEATDGVRGRGPVVLAVDNLPCQLPLESSEHFGDTLVRFVRTLAHCSWEADLDELGLPAEFSRAVILHRGALAPAFRHLEGPVARAASARA